MNSATATASGVATTSAMTAASSVPKTSGDDVGDEPRAARISPRGRDERGNGLGEQERRDAGQHDQDEDAGTLGQAGEDAVAGLDDRLRFGGGRLRAGGAGPGVMSVLT